MNTIEQNPEQKSPWEIFSEKELRDMADKKLAELTEESPAIRWALTFLEAELPKKYPELAKKFSEVLPYHGKHHTEDVMREAIFLALAEGNIDDRELLLLAIAAAYHDSGFALQYDANEALGAKEASKSMRNFDAREIDAVERAILATRVRFSPRFVQLVETRNKLGRILADADVGNFGRDDFKEKSELIFQELVAMDKISGDTPENRKSFNAFRKNMLATHEWQTEAAKHFRAERERENLAALDSER